MVLHHQHAVVRLTTGVIDPWEIKGKTSVRLARTRANVPPRLTGMKHDVVAAPVQPQRLRRLIRPILLARYERVKRAHRIPLKATARRVARKQLRQRLIDAPPDDLLNQ